MNKGIIMKLLLLLFVFDAGAQQDVQFSQYVFNGYAVNPAYAGYKGNTNLTAIYRHQWAAFPGAPQSATVAVDWLARDPDEKLGIGAQINWEQLGPQKSISLRGSYALRMKLNASGTQRLCLGIAVSATQYTIDGTVLSYIDPNDPVIPSAKVNAIVPDADFGAYYYTPTFYAGVSFLDLFSLNQERPVYYGGIYSMARLDKVVHMYVTSGFLWKVSDKVMLKPTVMIKEDFKGPASVDVNLFALLDERLWVGGAYRFGVSSPGKSGYQPGLERTAAASLMVELFANDGLRIGYAYDFTTSGLSTYQSGTHEISIGISLNKTGKTERVTNTKYF
jgi:type IX secretion system PorP/SprF family membrane protein